MKARLKFYGPLIAVNVLSLIYLLFFFAYNWYVIEFQTLDEALKTVIAENPRWVTWGICAGGLGLIAGCMLAISLLIQAPNTEDFLDLTDKSLGIFPSVRGFGLFIIFVIVGMLVVSEGGWQVGLRNGLEIIGVVVWVLFLVTGLTLIPTLLVDIFHKNLLRLIFKALSKEDHQG